jgi:replication factor C subunit 2/4
MFRFEDLLELDEDQIYKKKVKQPIYKKIVKNNKPWVDKYRPEKLEDIVYQEEVIKMLRKTLEDGNLPHTLFHGKPGSGKTSTILAVAMELFGPRVFRDRVIELNASDERGINVVRNKIVTFAKSAIGCDDPKYPCPPYKIIILDEADAMTTEAQSALRKTMEDYSNITRFCFICNYINQIIEPINSRCVKFRFKPLNRSSMLNKLESISGKEKLGLDRPCIEAVIDTSDGDLRKGIMILQNLKYAKIYKNNIKPADVLELASVVPDKIINNIKKICIDNKSAKPYHIVNLAKKIKTYGYPIHNIIKQIHDLIIQNETITDNARSIINIHLSKTEKRLIDCSDEYLQLLSILMCIRSAVLGLDTIYKN